MLRPGEKGRIQGLTDAMVNIASGIGSTGSGLIFAAVDFWVMSWLSIAIAVMPILLILFLPVWRRKLALEGAVSG